MHRTKHRPWHPHRHSVRSIWTPCTNQNQSRLLSHHITTNVYFRSMTGANPSKFSEDVRVPGFFPPRLVRAGAATATTTCGGDLSAAEVTALNTTNYNHEKCSGKTGYTPLVPDARLPRAGLSGASTVANEEIHIVSCCLVSQCDAELN